MFLVIAKTKVMLSAKPFCFGLNQEQKVEIQTRIQISKIPGQFLFPFLFSTGKGLKKIAFLFKQFLFMMERNVNHRTKNRRSGCEQQD